MEKAPVQDRIVEFTFYAFNQDGYRGVTMETVARELRISKKTIYKYFNTKEEILETALQQSFEQLESKVNSISAKSGGKEAFIAHSRLYMNFLGILSPQLRAEIKELIPYLEERIDLFVRQVMRKSLIKLLKELRNRGSVEYPAPTRELVECWFAMLSGLMGRKEDTVSYSIAAFYQGLRVRPVKKKK